MAIVPNNVKIQDFVEKYVTLNLPISYKGLNIYPTEMKNVYDFLDNYDILTIDKNTIGDIQIIQMSYLQFIFSLIVEDKIWRDKFLKIMNISFSIEKSLNLYNENYDYGELMALQEKDRVIMFFNGWNIYFCFEEENKISLVINGVEISHKEFEEIKRLIMYLNIVDYDDSYIDPDVKRATDDYFAFINKGIEPLTIEKKMAKICAVNGLNKKNFLDMSYREFNMIFESCKDRIDYQALVGKTEKPMEHWMYKKPFDPYKEAFSADSDLGNMINNSDIINNKQ